MDHIILGLYTAKQIGDKLMAVEMKLLSVMPELVQQSTVTLTEAVVVPHV